MNGLIQVELRPDHAMCIHRHGSGSQAPSITGIVLLNARRPAFRFAVFAPSLPRAVRVSFGRCAIVRRRLAAFAALPRFLRAVAFCFAVAIIAS
jgi:hypothetical protein